MANSNNDNDLTRHGLFVERGEPQVWMTGVALALVLLLTGTLLGVVMVNGLKVYWAHPIVELELQDGQKVMGEWNKTDVNDQGEQIQLKTGNRDLYGIDFRWVSASEVAAERRPEEAYTLERMEYGNFYGYLVRVNLSDDVMVPEAEPSERLTAAREAVEPMQRELDRYNDRTSAINIRMEKRRLANLEQGVTDDQDIPGWQTELERLVDEQDVLLASLMQNTATFADAEGRETDIPLHYIVRAYQPNAMSLGAKSGLYVSKLVELFTAEPRESNTEGGLFPAIFGTVMLVFIMSIFSFPFGVVAGVYLREYAKDGLLVRLVRITVNNLAGIPSIVYGIFGLGFFVYGMGGTIDQLFFAERLPTPTFGTGGILWASLTLGLMTMPVVIVSTEEALGAIPSGIREGALSLGATKFQTLVRILIPMASPGIMTGFILSMARAAGEVAPLMLTGVVKMAPALPIDGQFPFVHADRKFMHLGFHIYDIGFQSPNVEASMPMVYVTTLLLILIVLTLSSTAIFLRNRMKKRYTYRTF